MKLKKIKLESLITPYRLLWIAIGAFCTVAPYIPMVKVRMTFLMLVFMWIILAESFNIISGYTGYVCFGYAVFYGTGAILMAIALGEWNLHPLVAYIVAAVGTVALAAAIGYPTLRLRGAYFAIATLGISEAMKAVMAHVRPLGVFIPPPPAKIYLTVKLICYYAMMGIALGTILITYLIVNSKLGLGLIAIREDEDAAETRGVNTFLYKIISLMVSAVPTALAGATMAWYSTYVDCVAVYEVHRVVVLIAMGMFGGAGTILGPVVGATILYYIEDLLWAKFKYLHMVIFGGIICGVVLFLPQGIVGMLREKVSRFKKYLI